MAFDIWPVSWIPSKSYLINHMQVTSKLKIDMHDIQEYDKYVINPYIV